MAVLVLSIGLLGVASLQSAALRNNQSSYQRTSAVLLAYSILDAMRANHAQAVAGAYNLAIDSAAPSGTSTEQLDLSAWRTSIAVLPEGTGSVNCDNAAVPLCRITIRWNDGLGALGSNAQTFELRSQI